MNGWVSARLIDWLGGCMMIVVLLWRWRRWWRLGAGLVVLGKVRNFQKHITESNLTMRDVAIVDTPDKAP